MEGGDDQAKEGDSGELARENEELRAASSQNENIVMELSLGGRIQFLSKCWEDIVGTTIKKLLKKPVSKVIVGEKSDKEVFNNAVRVMEQEDSSYRVRFYVRMGEHRTHEEPERASSTGLPSSLPTGGMYFPFEDAGEETDDDDSDASDSGGSVDSGLSLPDDIDDTVIRLEGQGILIRDRASGRPTHVSIDYLNPKSLTGFSALAKYPDDASPQTPCY